MLLKKLTKISSKKIGLLNIRGLALDSRKTKKGYLFFAIKGSKFNGEKYIQEAIKKKSAAIICSKNSTIKSHIIPVIKTNNVRQELAEICKKFYKNKPKNIIAVTGTNGKTSVADFFHQILSINKIPVASIGTLGIKKNKNIKQSNLTSPDIISLHKELSNLKKSKINNVIIEASSHGLAQERLSGIDFKAGIFTNLSHDHLDYHKSMKNYFNAKMILFTKLLKINRYIITDSSIKEFLKIKKVAKKNKLKILTINKLLSKKNFSSNLVGSFQIKNLLMSSTAAQLCGIPKNKIFSAIKFINSVNGRLQLIKIFPNKTKIYIDYAHTPDALKAALKALKDYYKKNITLIFGCGGERDVEKRPLMAKIAMKYSNKIYITDDNPRNENAKKIRKKIIQHVGPNYIEIGNRSNAINHAIKKSNANEIILVAGKGHENLQDYGNKLINISDKKIIRAAKVKKIKSNTLQSEENLNAKLMNKALDINKNYRFKGISINSRDIKKGNLFVAIKGKYKNGNNYISQAIKNGANYCITSEKNDGKKIIKLNRNINFLNKFANLKRQISNATFIAVTGSMGKTSVKTLLGNLLRLYENTFYSSKSFNNHYGVPLSLSNLEQRHKYGVFEIGMSKKGEIDYLSKLVRPDIAIITNIGEAHIENFKNLTEIANAKSEIIENIKKGGVLVLNRDDKFFNFFFKLAKKKNLKIISFGLSKKSDICLISSKKFNGKLDVKIKIYNQTICLKDIKINISSILSSLCVLKYLNLDLSKIKSFISTVKPLDGRGQVHRIKRFKTKFNLIDESYNANPTSVKNAIINFSNKKIKNSKKYLLLGDMLELGSQSTLYHKNLSRVINSSDINKVFVYGEKILHTYKKIKKKKQGNILKNFNDFDDIFSKLIKKNDYLMIKGSNATGLNNLTKKVIKGIKNVI